MKQSVSLLLLSLSAACYASEHTGQLLEVRVASASLNGNPTHLKLAGTWANKPACATSGYWAINTDTPAGKNLLAAALLAQATGKSVRIWGSDQCNLRVDMETGQQIEVVQ